MIQHRKRSASQGRLSARPVRPVREEAPVGLQPLELDGPRDGLLYVPSTYRADRPLPLALMLHGAGGTARASLEAFLPVGKEVLLLIPDARGETWDIIEDRGYGRDVDFLDRALLQTFSRYAVDQAHLAIGGFSDGASYALSLGLTNGDLFTHILAFSPGFVSPAHPHGRPRIHIAHGTRDTVLPIERCSRRIVPRLQREHYEVDYHEFDGPHALPTAILQEGWRWFLNTQEP